MCIRDRHLILLSLPHETAIKRKRWTTGIYPLDTCYCGRCLGSQHLLYSTPVSYTHLDVYKRQAYGNAEKTAFVRTPLMMLSTLPRVLSIQEEITVPVNIFAMENQVKNVTVDVYKRQGLSEPFQDIYFSVITYHYDNGRNQLFRFQWEYHPHPLHR